MPKIERVHWQKPLRCRTGDYHGTLRGAPVRVRLFTNGGRGGWWRAAVEVGGVKAERNAARGGLVAGLAFVRSYLRDFARS